MISLISELTVLQHKMPEEMRKKIYLIYLKIKKISNIQGILIILGKTGILHDILKDYKLKIDLKEEHT